VIVEAMPGDNFFWQLKMALGFVLWQSGTAVMMGEIRRVPALEHPGPCDGGETGMPKNSPQSPRP
jgi:hypothetical protein